MQILLFVNSAPEQFETDLQSDIQARIDKCVGAEPLDIVVGFFTTPIELGFSYGEYFVPVQARKEACFKDMEKALRLTEACYEKIEEDALANRLSAFLEEGLSLSELAIGKLYISFVEKKYDEIINLCRALGVSYEIRVFPVLPADLKLNFEVD